MSAGYPEPLKMGAAVGYPLKVDMIEAMASGTPAQVYTGVTGGTPVPVWGNMEAAGTLFHHNLRLPGHQSWIVSGSDKCPPALDSLE